MHSRSERSSTEDDLVIQAARLQEEASDPPPWLDLDAALGLPAPAVPEQIGGFRVLQLIGEGGMGSVYLAEQQRPVRRKVAIKVIKVGMDSKAVLARFAAEEQALALMDHPGIAGIHEAGSIDENRPYFVMEYVRGDSITHHCDRHRLSVRQRLELFAEACDAIQHAHQKGIIHRDIKPAHILVEYKGKPTIKIVDFGLAKAIGPLALTEQTLHTLPGDLLGTPLYMSPEQWEYSNQDIDTRADIYSLGVVLYELLTGSLPFERESLRGKSRDEIGRYIREVDPPSPSRRVSYLSLTGELSTESVARNRQVHPRALRRTLSGYLDWITMKALEKDRIRRYASASEFAEQIRMYLRGESPDVGPPSVLYRYKRFIVRHRVMAAATAMVFLVLVTGIIVSASFARQKAREAFRANKSLAMLQQYLISPVPEKRGADVRVIDVVEQMAADLDNKAHLSEFPEVEAELRLTVGRALLRLERVNDAKPHFDRVMQLREALFGPDDPRTAEALASLGEYYLFVRDYEKSAHALERCLAIRQRRLGVHPDTAATHLQFGILAWSRGDLDESKRQYEQALAIARDVMNASTQVQTMTRLAAIHRTAGEFAAAEALLQEALAMARSRCHPSDVAKVLQGLSSFYDVSGQPEKAVEAAREAMEIRIGLHGRDHTDYADLNIELALIYLRQDQPQKAEYHARLAVEAYRERKGPNHLCTAMAGVTFARALDDCGRHEEALAEFDRVLSVMGRSDLPDSTNAVKARAYRARCLMRLNRLCAAEHELAKALAYAQENGTNEKDLALYQAWMAELRAEAADNGNIRGQSALVVRPHG